MANYICNNKPFVWLPFCFPHHRFHPLESRYIALPCDDFFSYLKYGSASLEDDFYKIILVLCFLLWGYPIPLFNTQVIWISVCLALRVSTAFLILHPKTNCWLSVSRPIHRLRLVLKLNSDHTRRQYHNIYRNMRICHLSCCRGCHLFTITNNVSMSLNINLVCWMLIHFLPVCTAVCTETKFTTFTSLYLRQRLVW